jgi:hypothetical protein
MIVIRKLMLCRRFHRLFSKMGKVKKVKEIKSKVRSIREIKKSEEDSGEKSGKEDTEFHESVSKDKRTLEEDVKDVAPAKEGKEEIQYKSRTMPDQEDVAKNYEIEQVQIQRFEQTRGRRNMVVPLEEPRVRNTTAPPRIEREGQREEIEDRRGENYIPQGEVKRSARRKMPWE